jgi:acetolactate synthase I/III small subunit
LSVFFFFFFFLSSFSLSLPLRSLSKNTPSVSSPHSQQQANLVKQVAKLVKVRYVEDITPSPRVERELVLLRIPVPSTDPAGRTAVLQLADVFRASVVDVGEGALTLCVAGDAGKTAALERALAPWGVAALARTGRIALKRGPALLEMGGWGDSSLGGRGSSATTTTTPVPLSTADSASGGGGVYEAGAPFTPLPATVCLDAPSYSPDAAAAAAEAAAAAGAPAPPPPYEPHTLSVIVSDTPGVLNQVTGVLARRGVNVQSLAVGPSESPGESRITAVIPGEVTEGETSPSYASSSSSSTTTAKIVKQLEKLVYVREVTDLTDVPFVARELMLVKVRAHGPAARRAVTDLAAIFRGTVCDVSPTTITVELVGKEAKMRALNAMLEPYGILEIARTGRVALPRASGVDTRSLGRSEGRRVMV